MVSVVTIAGGALGMMVVVGCASAGPVRAASEPAEVLIPRCVAVPTAPDCPRVDRAAERIMEGACPGGACVVAQDCDGDGIREDLGACVDTDADGVPDAGDRCPGAAESFNGYEDKDGCPEALPSSVCADERAARVYFFAGVADVRIAKSEVPLLNHAVTFLREHPQLGLAIEGHASPDEARTTEARERLARLRAEVVRDRLVKLGIEGHRLEVRSFGATRPLEDCDARKASGTDRRVELSTFDQKR